MSESEAVSTEAQVVAADEAEAETEAAQGAPSETAPEMVADPVLLAAVDQARSALTEITRSETIGEFVGHEVLEAHVLTLFFDCTMDSYPGWRWAATLARVDEESAVNVLEVDLLPGEGALVAPEWVPWSVRLAQYREAQARQAAEEAAAAEAAAEELAEDDDLDAEDDLLDNDFSDFEDEIDGVDLEEEDDDIDDSDEDDSDDDVDDTDEE